MAPGVSNDLPCTNCRNPVSTTGAKIFAGVYVCTACYEKAERLHNKCEGELKRLLLMLREAIRIALVEGKLQYAPATPLDEVPKAELLKMIAQLVEKKDAPAQHAPSIPRPAGR